jgi:hypothetical protein
VNGRALARAVDRDAVRAAWAVGEGYRGVELATLRVRTARPLGLPGGVVPPALLRAQRTLGAPAPAPLPRSRTPAQLWPLPAASALAAGSAAAAAGSTGAGLATGAATGALVAAAVGGRRYAAQLRALQAAPEGEQTATLRQLASVVADALQASGLTSVGAGALRVTGARGGEVACELEAPTAESLAFASCLDELLSPLGDPRWLVSRLVLPVPAAAADRRRLARARALGRAVEAAVAWHAVPAPLGRSRERVAAFEDAWRRHVGPPRLVLAKDPEGTAVLELLRGEDPFALTSRLRTVWR